MLAARIAEKVGLDERYSIAVENFRDRMVANGAPKGDIKTATGAYVSRLRMHRAMVIARYEVAKALADAQRLLWAQQQQDGDVSRYAVRVWRLHKDERLCKVCRPLNGRRASIRSNNEGYFIKGLGRVEGPPIHPQCRCYEELIDQGVTKTDPDLWGPDDQERTQMAEIEKKGLLDRSPKHNWVEDNGGLPKYIEHIANDLHTERGMDISRAIAVAISRVKMWAAGGGGVKPDTKAKSVKAVAEWEAMKAKARAKH